VKDGLTFAANSKEYRQVFILSTGLEEISIDTLIQSDQLNSFSDLSAFILAELSEKPQQVINLYLTKIARSWFGTDSGRFELPILLIQIPYFLLFVYALKTAWDRRGVYRQFAFSVVLFVIYFWGMTVMVLSILRYMIPAIGLLFLLIPSLMESRPVKSLSSRLTSRVSWV
jgi:hypothetical protein